MEPFVLRNARIGADGRAENVGIDASGKFADITDGGEEIDVAGLRVLPGFIDVHIHGAVGVDVNTADADGLLEVARFLAVNGVTAWVPTLVPDSDENYARAIAAIDRLMELQTERPVAQAVGVHYEGVFANEKMCGALRPEFFKQFTGSEADELPRLKRGVHMTTFAPEAEGGIALAAELKRLGWVASIGHTRASAEILDQAFAAGAEHITHFYNAMTGFHHRDIGVVGWGLTNPDVSFDIIADGMHVAPGMLDFACRIKGADKVLLISDSVAPTGSGDGEFIIWGERVEVRNGITRNERGSIAGSVITLREAVDRMRSLGFSDGDLSKMAAGNAARLLRLEDSLGSIRNGLRADLAVLDDAGNVRMTVIGGRIVFRDRI